MQSVPLTPAESLVQRLLKTENIQSAYLFVIEKTEAHTNILMQCSGNKADGAGFHPTQQRG